ncbi:carboxypeptidase B [Folsomia candida]|uniref:carboxypeptidase B n=1 Tax=Folsomia candida TaxID=158441 RepID=UPI000B90966C|nr:carboxypeptidase B [Folsomia candida]
MYKLILTVLAFCLIQTCAAKTVPSQGYQSFDGYQVIRAQARTLEQGMSLINLQRDHPSLDFWKEPSLTDDTDFMVPSDKILEISQYLSLHNVEFYPLIKDVGQLIASQYDGYQMTGVREPISWTKYHNLATMYEWFQNLTEAHSFVHVYTIGQSTEGRDIKVVRLSKDPSANKPAMFIDSAIHAREWISLATVSYIMNQIVNNPEDNALLDDVDFYFLPIINPDGYEYTFTTNRMWRKTRSRNSASCYGVDANRNYDYEWSSCSGCSSGVCTSETFRGDTPFSEPETEAMRVFIEQSKQSGVNFQSYISVHSYGQYFMLPWGYTPAPPADYEELQMVANYVAGNISAVYGTEYTTGSSSTTIYPTDGTSQDWAYGTGLFKYVYTAELRDKGIYGFILPPTLILPTAEETWAGFKVVAKHIIGK